MKKILSVVLSLCILMGLFAALTLTASAESVSKESDFFIADNVLLEYTGNAEKVVIPDTVGEIDNNLFVNHEEIKTIVMPNCVTKIGSAAFYGCKNLQSINLSDNLAEIGNQAFENCTSLKKITIPGSLKVISQGLLRGCTNVETIEIGYGVEELKFGVFGDCAKVKKLVFPETVKVISGQIMWFGADAFAITANPEIEMIVCNPDCKLGEYTVFGSNPVQEGIAYPIRGYSASHVHKVNVTIKSVAGSAVEKFYKNYMTQTDKKYVDSEKVLKVSGIDNPYACVTNTFVGMTKAQLQALPENKSTYHPAGKPVAPKGGELPSGGDTSTDTPAGGDTSTDTPAGGDDPTGDNGDTPADDPNNNGNTSNTNSGNKKDNSLMWLIIIIAIAVVLLAAAVVLFILIKKGIIGGAKAAAVDEIPVEEEISENIEE